MRRPAHPRKKLKNRSPHAVLRWLKGMIPFFGETNSQSIAAIESFSHCWPGHD